MKRSTSLFAAMILIAIVGMISLATEMGCASSTKTQQSSASQPTTTQSASAPGLLQTIATDLFSPEAIKTEAQAGLHIYNAAVADGDFKPTATESAAATLLQTSLNDINASNPSATNYQQLVNDLVSKSATLLLVNSSHNLSATPASTK